ncbi:MAG: carbon-nitrogen hydrolase family protein [Candidatus Accumulibacter sp.]|jgi:nitrilase|nr:carbon-nitrogen hydrolase family protein [Accumulibacter sp.]
MKATLIQINSQDDKAANLATMERLIDEAVEKERPDLIVFPEYCAFLSADSEAQRASGEPFPSGESFRRMAAKAKAHKVTIHAGSMVEADGDKRYNTTGVFGPQGEVLAKYRKIHLFDVVVPGGIRYLESEMVSRGSDIITYRLGEFVIGCAICYDVRFPEIFRGLRDAGADIIVLPAAFTAQTGKDHWEVLARARAIETQTYFLATGQVFTHAEGKKACWGHSMIVDPWGAMVAQASDRVGFVSARFDKAYIEQIRVNVPVDKHHVLG